MRPFRLPTFHENNWLFTAIVMGGGGVLGSMISVLVAGAMLVNPVHAFIRRAFRMTRDPAVWAIGTAFTAYYLVQVLAELANYSSYESFYPLAGNLPFLAIVLTFSRLTATSSRRSMLGALEAGVISGALASFAWAAIQTAALGYPRAEGLAGNPGPFALVNAVLLGLCVVAAIRRDGALRVVAVVAAVAAAGAILLSGMRTLWPMLLIAPGIAALVMGPRMRALLTPRHLLALAAGATLVAVLAWPIVSERIAAVVDDHRSITEDGDFDNSLGQHILVWQAGYALALEQPFLGHGSRNTPALMAERTARDDHPGLQFSHFHNFVINAWAKSGLLGVIALVAMLVLPLWLMARAPRDDLGDAGLAIMAVVIASYLMSGTVGIMLGHDILDALFVYSTVMATFLVFGGPHEAGRPASPGAASEP